NFAINDHVAYAHSRGIPVLIDSTSFAPWAVKGWASAVQWEVTTAAKSYPWTVFPTWPTNSGGALNPPSAPTDYWKPLVDGVPYAGGYAVSDQSWFYGYTDWYDANPWWLQLYVWWGENNTGYGPAARYIEFEPSQYLFNVATPWEWPPCSRGPCR